MQGYMRVMVVLVGELVVVFPLVTLRLLAVLAAHASGRHQELLEGRAECPALLVLLVLHLLLAGCLGKAAVVVGLALLALAVLAVLVAVALAAAVVVPHAVHTRPVLVA